MAFKPGELVWRADFIPMGAPLSERVVREGSVVVVAGETVPVSITLDP